MINTHQYRVILVFDDNTQVVYGPYSKLGTAKSVRTSRINGNGMLTDKEARCSYVDSWIEKSLGWEKVDDS